MFVTLRKNIVLIILFVAILASLTPMAVLASSSGKKVIVLDAGHGGYDGGVSGVASKVKESDINLEMVLLLKGYLEAEGFKVVLTRSKDKALGDTKREDMNKRIKIINDSNPVLFISLHSNFYSSPYRRGIQAFFNKGIDEELACSLQDRVNESLNYPTINRNLSSLFGDYYMLANTNVPSALIECGFLSNVEDEKLLLDKGYRMKLAYIIYLGIKDYLDSSSEDIAVA